MIGFSKNSTSDRRRSPTPYTFFVGLNDEHKALVQQRFVEFICFKTGGPCIYTGRDMKATHTDIVNR